MNKVMLRTLKNMVFTANIMLIVSCGGGDESSPIDPSNNKPNISGNPDNKVMEGSTYSFSPSSSDKDGDTLTFNITNKPSWAEFNSSTGGLSGIPTKSNVGTYSNIVITVSDGKDNISLPEFEIIVEEKPALGGEFWFDKTAYTINEGENIVTMVKRSNANGSATVSYNTKGVTAVNASDYIGNASQPITFADGVSSLTITVETINDQVHEDTETFEIELKSPSTGYTLTNNKTVITILDNDAPAANTPPTISGSPATTVMENSFYSFTPTASDADSDTLTFSVTNAPSWGSFDTTTGTLSGTPSTSDIGTTQGIVITVTDGTDSVSLSQFDITVTSSSQQTGSVTLSWQAPTNKENGDELDDLSGYYIYYGDSSGTYTDKITINSPSIVSKLIDKLTVGKTYYFVLSSFNTAGDESKKSNEVLKLIQ